MVEAETFPNTPPLPRPHLHMFQVQPMCMKMKMAHSSALISALNIIIVASQCFPYPKMYSTAAFDRLRYGYDFKRR